MHRTTAMTALALETYRLTKRFGAFTALDAVSVRVRPATVHALLGENGAGKSTLVKCIVGYHRPDEGAVLVDGREHDIHAPTVARALGIGMVYQHFTVVPGMTVAENLLIAKGDLPAVVDWKRVRAELRAFMDSAPFRLDLDATPLELSAGEKQKLEILKQLYLSPRLLILDEPTSVLTPQEADEVLGALRERAHAGACSVVMITHKFREVTAFADDVTVLRRGRLVASLPVAGTDASELAARMVGDDPAAREEAAEARALARSAAPPGAVRLAIRGLTVRGDRGQVAVDALDLEVRAGEIVGIAGVSGNGQRELMEALAGQRRREAGAVEVGGRPYRATRAQNRALKVRALPEEPLRNGCVASMSVADNIGLRSFDAAPHARAGFRVPGSLARRARELIAAYRVKTQGESAPIGSLSGGNVQRAVLARELSDDADVLLVSNAAFGLDFTAVAEVHARLIAARDRGAAVLMVSEDLDELLHVADRIVVMSEGRLVYECRAEGADRHDIGRFMGGHGAQHGTADMRVIPSRAATAPTIDNDRIAA
ncbi:ABC transporter ATP-binding protein [Calidifontimicrobium sp. SYSU G02091]|uniref:ABC transporter ATP-binding protein n=1 Tax=Calidifontimicrobium sp. SYSU G02091 TaxID=2926421 RepID=UPI001F52C0B0|nr:ABC transporter ATP-binding protein [Calidifontimicrobium sp. SYSU G02091]MCI1191299.1 ABC transporter ATP-binding protein [Calidifontimicrobium sp. SYSU G02091]